MSRNPAVMTELAGLEERLSALLQRLEQTAGSASQRWANMPGRNNASLDFEPAKDAALPETLPTPGEESRLADELAALLRQTLRAEQPDDAQEMPSWAAGLQIQLTQVEQQIESLREHNGACPV